MMRVEKFMFDNVRRVAPSVLGGAWSRRLGAVALAALATLATACGGGPIALRGRVLDDKGTPVKGAEIETEPATDPAQTNAQGFFVVNRRITEEGEAVPLEPGDYVVRVRMLGFDDAEVRVKAEGGEQSLPPISLAPKSLDIGDTAPDTLDETPTDMDSSSTPVNGN